MEPKYLTSIVKDLAEGTCTLVLGPDAYLLDNDEVQIKSHRDELLASAALLANMPYAKDDGFFYPKNQEDWYYDKGEILDAVKKYYAGLQPPGFYNMLAALPFNLIISLSPDDLFAKAMQQKHFAHAFTFYKPKSNNIYQQVKNEGKSDDFVMKSNQDKLPDGPIVFNFLGHYLHSDSLVFTYDAMFDFFNSIFPVETKLPDLLRSISNTNSFLFIGFGYDKWYLKILFNIIETIPNFKGKNKKAIFNYAAKHEDAVKIFKTQFRIDFFQEGTIDFITKTLYPECSNAGIIRKSIQPKNEECKIMYFSTLPDDLIPLRFDKEYKRIDDTLKEYKRNHLQNLNDFELQQIQCTTQKDFIKEMIAGNPHIVVLSLHGNKNGDLWFQDKNGQPDPLQPANFLKDIELMKQATDCHLQVVLFSSCYSDKLAEKTAGIISNAVGMEGAIAEEAMVEFCEGFFSVWFEKRLLPMAVNAGITYIDKQPNLKGHAARVKQFPQIVQARI